MTESLKVTRARAESLRADDRHWRVGIIYACRQDPRIIVRNRFIVGWTWNFGHPLAVPAIVVLVFALLAPMGWLITRPNTPAWLVVSALVVLFGATILWTHRSASGPRGGV